MKTISKLVLSGFGTGYLPVAPGTWGSAAVLAIYLLYAWFGQPSAMTLTVAMGALAAWSSVVCVLYGSQAEELWGKKDPGHCTIDEWAGQAVTLLWLPVIPRLGFGGMAGIGCAGFVVFRIFDIIKPPPARLAERLPQGWGVLADDLIAGVYANVVVRLAVLLFVPVG